MNNLRNFALLLVAFLMVNLVSAQENLDGYNTFSMRPIHTQNQLYKQTHWTYVDLREKQNRPFFAENNQLTAIIIDAVKAGIVRPFQSDSMVNRMTYETFIENLTIPSASSESDSDFESGWGEDETWEDIDTETEDFESVTEVEDEPESSFSNEYFANQLYVLEIKEDVIFDKKTSRMRKQIQAITIKIPAEQSPTGIEKILASFSYKELVNNVFRDNPKAIWFNNSNLSASLNFADAFENRLYSAHLIKYANGDDLYIEDIYGTGKNALMASQQIQYEILDKEMDMWEN